jgi:hypothetical protein
MYGLDISTRVWMSSPCMMANERPGTCHSSTFSWTNFSNSGDMAAILFVLILLEAELDKAGIYTP